MKLCIADYLIEYIGVNPLIQRKTLEYTTSFYNSDLRIIISDNQIEAERIIIKKEITALRAENNVFYREIAEWLPLQNALVMHSATFDVDGAGVAFAAHSGTGKTTHMLLWQKLLGDRLKIVNGDKPIVRYFDDQPHTPYAYGTPWNGKEHLGCNMRTPLKHICFIERAEQNSCEKMDKNDAVNLIFNQVYMPKDPAAAANTIVLINRLISDCSLWKIKCNMDISAAETAYRTIFGE